MIESEKPAQIGEWSLSQIQQALSRKLPEALLASRRQGGTNLSYIPWHVANRILDKYAPGWTWEIHSLTVTADRLFLVGRLTIITSEGPVHREASGTEMLKEDYFDKEDNIWKIREIAYGDPSSNAESMAFRRAAARFGLGLYLKDKR